MNEVEYFSIVCLLGALIVLTHHRKSYWKKKYYDFIEIKRNRHR